MSSPFKPAVLVALIAASSVTADDGGHGHGGYSSNPFGTDAPITGDFSIAGLTIEGPLSPEQVSRVLQMNRNQVRYCYELAHFAPGRTDLSFAIAPSGAVSNVKLSSPSSAAADCVAGRPRTWMFPKAAQGSTVKVGLVISSRDGG